MLKTFQISLHLKNRFFKHTASVYALLSAFIMDSSSEYVNLND